MCGIVGIISKNGTLSYYCEELFTNMLRMDSVRGPDSTGCFGIDGNGKVDMLKGDTDGWKFITTTAYDSFKKRINRNYKVVIGHNRKATSGKVSASNAHPFQEKHIMMVHNGSIRNAKDMADTEVDSHAIAHALSEHDAVTALGQLDGAYAIVWYDGSDKTISLARNKERPLFLLEYGFIWCISSEPGLPLWLNAREERKPDKVLLVPTEKILTFNLEQLSKGFYEIPYEEFKAWKKPIHTPFVSQYPTINTPSSSEVVNLFPHQRVGVTSPFKTKDIIHFVLNDSKIENGAEVLLGHPLVEGIVDENIFVRTVLKKGDDAFAYFGPAPDFTPKQWRGTVQHVRPLVGISTIYVNQIEEVIEVKDAQNNELEAKDVEEAIKGGCSRCHASMTMADVPNSIVRKNQSTGGWRIICPACLNVAVTEAQRKQPGTPLRARTH